MIIKVLAENTSISDAFGSEHGLSLYIETNKRKRKILFDVGASNLSLKNAKKLDVNIPDVDYLIVSHGHYDHGGGLRSFLRVNKKAEVFIHNLAFGKYYSLRPNKKMEYIGLDEGLKNDKRIILTSDRFFISKGIHVLSNITQKEPLPTSNRSLFMEQDGHIVQDNFAHEQILIIEEKGNTILFTGCAHNGIVNILEHFYYLEGRMPDYVIGGFHLSNPSAGTHENLESIDKVSEYLMNTNAKYYPCHCTGIEPYNRLKSFMGDSIDYLSAGRELIIPAS